MKQNLTANLSVVGVKTPRRRCVAVCEGEERGVPSAMAARSGEVAVGGNGVRRACLERRRLREVSNRVYFYIYRIQET